MYRYTWTKASAEALPGAPAGAITVTVVVVVVARDLQLPNGASQPHNLTHGRRSRQTPCIYQIFSAIIAL